MIVNDIQIKHEKGPTCGFKQIKQKKHKNGSTGVQRFSQEQKPQIQKVVDMKHKKQKKHKVVNVKHKKHKVIDIKHKKHKTRNQLRVAIECHKGMKVKVVKWC